jgi:hypothetical protein
LADFNVTGNRRQGLQGRVTQRVKLAFFAHYQMKGLGEISIDSLRELLPDTFTTWILFELVREEQAMGIGNSNNK